MHLSIKKGVLEDIEHILRQRGMNKKEENDYGGNSSIEGLLFVASDFQDPEEKTASNHKERKKKVNQQIDVNISHSLVG